MQQLTFTIDSQDVQQRLDSFLSAKMVELTRSHIKNMIQKDQVVVNGKVVKAGYMLKLGDVVSLDMPEPTCTDINPENIPLDIVYQDQDLAVINKKQGMVTHPSSGCYSGTLVNALLYHIKDLSGINGEIRPGIVHRLDKDTSGLIVIAKNDKAHISLAKQIQDKVCKRNYLALVYGSLKQEEGTIQTNLKRGEHERKKIFVVRPNEGKVAITNYKVKTRYKGYTLVEYELKTGRTHQIRVHSTYIGHPIVGDKTYYKTIDKTGLDGQLLHAYKIGFNHPTTGEFMQFTCPLPDYFEKFLNTLQN